MKSNYIINFDLKINSSIPFNQCNDEKSIIENSISLMNEYLEKKCNIDLRNNCLKNKEDLIQKILLNIFDNINIDYCIIEIKNIIDENAKDHSAIIVKLNDKNYLIDPTYRQFFLENNCQEDSYIVNDKFVLISPDPGFYYLKNPDMMPIAKEILSNGYIELNENIAKAYGDSFKITSGGRINKEDIKGSEYLKRMLNEKEKIRAM